MNQFALTKQILDFNRTTFETTYGTLNQLQEQSEKIMNTWIEQADWIPADGKKAVADMSATFKKGCQEFKKFVDENFVRVEAYFTEAQK